MDRNQIPMQADPRLGFVQSTDIQYHPAAADVGPRLSTPGQTLPPPPPLVRHGQITSAATTGSGTPVAATFGNSMRPGINPSQSRPSFPGIPPQGVQQYGTNWVSPGNGTFIRKHGTVPDPLMGQAFRQQLQHVKNNSPNLVSGNHAYGSIPDRLNAPSRDQSFMPGTQPQSVAGLRHGAPRYPANFSQAGSAYVTHIEQLLVSQDMRDLQTARQGVVRVSHPVLHKAHVGSSGQSFSANQRTAHVNNTYNVGSHNQRQFVSQSLQEHTSLAQSPYPSQPMPGHISPGHFQSMPGHISQRHFQSMPGHISPGYSQPVQGNISPGYSQEMQDHISPGNSQSIQGHVSPAQGQVRMSGQSYISQGLSNEQNLRKNVNSLPQAQGNLPGQFQQQMGKVNAQGSISGWQQSKGPTSSQGFINIAEAATSLSFLAENRQVGQLSPEARNRLLQYKERLEKSGNQGMLSTGETVDELIGRMIEKIKERQSGNSENTPQNQQHTVAQTHTTPGTVTASKNLDNVSAIQSAFAIPASSAPDDKGVLSRWYAPPSSQSNLPPHTSTCNTSPIINSETSLSTCTRPSGTSGLVSYFSPPDNSYVTSQPVTETAAITTSACNMPSYSEEPFVLKPLICNEKDIKYSVPDLLRCLPQKVRFRHSSSIDSDRSTELAKNDTTTTSEKTCVESGQIEQNPRLPPVASVCEQPSEENEKVPEKISSREITPDLDEQLMETDSLLDHSKNQLLDRLVLDSHFGTQDMNPEIDYRNYLPSPGFPADFVMTPSPDFKMEEDSSANCDTVDGLSEASSGIQSKKLDAPGEVENSNSQTSDGKDSFQNLAVNKDKIDDVQPSKKRKLGAFSDSNLSMLSPQVKRQRGGSRGRGRGCQQLGGRGRGRGRGRGKGRGRPWAVSLTRNKKQSKPAPVTRKQTARCSRGKGKLKASFNREGNATGEVDTSEQAPTVAALEGQVIQKPQDLKKLMDNLPHEELEKTTVSLSFLKMMLAWQEAKTNAGPDDVDQECDTASDTSVSDETRVNDGENSDSKEKKSKSNNKGSNDNQPNISKVELKESENSGKILKSEKQNNNMKKPSEESSSSMIGDKPVTVFAKSIDRYEKKQETDCEHTKNGNLSNKSDNDLKSAETGKQNDNTSDKEVIETNDDTARAVVDLGYASRQDISLSQNNNGSFGNEISDSPTISEETGSQVDAPTEDSRDNKNTIEDRFKGVLNEDDNKSDTKICDISNTTSKSSIAADASSEDKVNDDASKAVSEQKKADIEVTAVDNTSATQVYSVTDTHKMTWVRFHGRTVTQLITPSGKFFILKEILRRCFRIQEPNKNLQFNRIGILKRKVLKIPDIELEPLFYDYVVKNLIDRKVIRTIPDKFIIISEEDANRLFHHVCQDQYCGNACVTPFFQKQTCSAVKPEKTEQTGLAASSDKAVAGSSINSNNTPLPEKGRNLFDILEKEASSKIEKIQSSGEDKEKQGEITDLCPQEDELNGYDSDKTLPYVDGKPMTIRELEKENTFESLPTSNKLELSEKPDSIKSNANSNFDKNLDNEVRGEIECQDKAKFQKQKAYDCANKGSDFNHDVSLSEKSKTADECANSISPVVSALKNVQSVNNRNTESQGLTSSEIIKNKSQVSDCDVIIIDDDYDDKEEENRIIETADDWPDELGMCKLTLDQIKKEISVLNQEHVNSIESGRHSAELVQVNNIDSTAVSVSGDTIENRNTGTHLKNNKRRIFDGHKKNSDKLKTDVSGTGNPVGDIVKEKIKGGTDISDTDNGDVSDSNENTIDNDQPSDDVDADVIIGDWVFPAPPKNYPENGTKKLEKAEETLEKIIEQANSAKSTEDYVDILDTVFKLKEPLQQWTNTLLDHYEEGLLIEAQRLKSLDQLKLTDI